MRKQRYLYNIIMIVIVLAGCNTIKHIPQDEKLYTGATLKIKNAENIGGGKKDLKYELEDVLSPQPNKKVLGIRFGLWLRYKAQAKPKNKLIKKLEKRYGEKPVYLSDVNTLKNEKILLNRLENKGYFGSEVTSAIKEKGRTGYVVYSIKVPDPYVVQTYTYLPDSSSVDILTMALEDSTIKKGTQFNTDLLKEERVRIDHYLKDRGFYHFNDGYLNFITDTNQYHTKRFDLYLSVKKNTPDDAKRHYRIKRIYVYPDYSMDEPDSVLADTAIVEGIVFRQGERKFKPKHLTDYIMFRKGDLFSQTKRTATTRKISAMGNFQYVSIRYETDTLHTDSMGFLDAHIRLSPYKRRSLRVEVQGVTKSNNFAGPAVIVSYINRNLFSGGEILEIAGNASYEAQIAKGTTKGLSSFQFSLNNGLTFPRIFPFRIRNIGGYTVPKTKIGINLSLISRAQYYKLNTYQLEYGFKWNSHKFITHEIYPVDLIYTNVYATTPKFDAKLDSNAFLAQSFQDQFIPGLTYSCVFSQLGETEREHRFFAKATLDVAGNVTGVVQNLFKQEKLIFGLPYAQYAKVDADLRHYVRIGRESQWINRVFAGWSIPYRNSSTLPYIKQYFSGGPNSIRAFRVRSLGPGSYDATTAGASFFDQSGDIKLEFNTEFRHPIISILKGAVFLDAGNIWLANDNEAIPGGKFTSNWYKQIAMGFGYGLRLDIKFLVIRFDFATPLRTPSDNLSKKWFNDIGVWRGQGVKENMVVNFSIGYPF